MNVLITGAPGFIGQNLAMFLSRRSDTVIYSLRRDRGCMELMGNILIGDVCDLRRMQEIMVSHEIDQVYHLAARSIVRNCVNDPVGCFHVNVMGTATVLEAARLSGRVRGVVCAESDKSYGPGPVPYREDQPLRPEAVYEASKACVSHLAAAYFHNYGLPVVTVRTANVYGERDQNTSRLVPNTILRIMRGMRPQITTGAADYRREFVYVGDVCEAYWRVMNRERWGEAVNIGSGECLTVRGVVANICRAMGVTCMTDEWERPAGLLEIADQSLDLTKLRIIWEHYRPMQMADILPVVIEWYRRHPR